jgi:lysophospholipase L1-like esterase
MLRKFVFCGAAIAAWSAACHAAITIMPLGDSISAGYDGSPMAGYRQDLLNDLTGQGVKIQYAGVYDPTPGGTLGASASMTALGQNMITAFGGYGTGDLAANLAGDVPANTPITPPDFVSNQGGYWLTGGNGTGRAALDPNIVLLMAGTNDYFMGTSPETGITNILDWFESNRPGTLVLVASPPPSINSSYAIEPIVQAENAWLASNINPTEFPDARYVDVYDSFLGAGGAINQSLLGPDGIHPTDSGYAVIASDYDSVILSSVPEPSSAAMFSLGLAWLSRRTRRPSLT